MATLTRLLALGTVLALAVPSGPAAGRPAREAPFTPLTVVPGTTDQTPASSTTTPDGTDVVLWVDGPSGDRALVASVRRPGRAVWKAVPRAFGASTVQQVDAAPIGPGDVQVAWASGAFPDYEVMTARLSTATGTWSAPVQVFSSALYHHEAPQIAVRRDGTVLVLARAVERVASTPHRDRTVVGVRRPGGPIATTYLSPADTDSIPYSLSVDEEGRALATFTSGNNLGNVVVNAATLDVPSSATWNSSPLSAAGHGNLPAGSVTDGGRAAVVWYDPTASTDIAIATGVVGAGPTTWSQRPVKTGGGLVQQLAVAAFPNGASQVAWVEFEAGKYVDKGRVVNPGSMGPIQLISDPTTSGANHILTARPDGRVLLQWRDYTSGPDHHDRLRARLLTGGVPGPAFTLADSPVGGSVGALGAAADAASRVTVFLHVGDGTKYDLAWLGQSNVKPAVLVNPYSGVKVTRATLVRRGGGAKLRCRTGFWVESTAPKYRWFRDGDKVAGARRSTYKVRGADAGHRLSCQAKGRNKLSKKSLTLKSKVLRVR